MSVLSPASNDLALRRLTAGDLPLLAQWLNAGTVLEWYGLKAQSLADIEAHYGPMIRGEEPSHGYLALCDNLPIGYLQWYRIADWPDYARQVDVAPGITGIDMFLADAFHGRGLAIPLINLLIDTEIAIHPDITGYLLGPDPRNVRAIAVYENAGFTRLKWVPIDDEPHGEQLLVRMKNL